MAAIYLVLKCVVYYLKLRYLISNFKILYVVSVYLALMIGMYFMNYYKKITNFNIAVKYYYEATRNHQGTQINTVEKYEL